MPKINQEEYEVLKNLDGKWKWIARDDNYGGFIFCFREKPHKDIRRGEWSPEITQYEYLEEYDLLFQFIQWEDEEPHNIAELIEEYESEEAEVKDIEWLKEEVGEMYTHYSISNNFDFVSKRQAINEIKNLLEQLDEPEVLSSDWIDKNKTSIDRKLDGTPIYKVREELLQNLLVPKQEELTDEQIARKVDQAYKDGYEKGKEHATEKERETVGSVFVDFLLASAKLKLALAMEVEELEE